MIDKEHEKIMRHIRKDTKRIKTDWKYAHEVYMYHGILTKKGNLTKRWRLIKKLYGIAPHQYEVIRRELA